MQWTIVGLGNPGDEYEGSRHNAGRDLVRSLAEKEGIKEWKADKKSRSLLAKGDYFGEKAVFALPETFMNNSGGAVKALAPALVPKKGLEKLVVFHDDLDLPIGVLKMSFGSGAGGHKGVESIQKALKTKDFVRVRIGISGATPSGKLKKPDSEKVIDYVLGKFRAPEIEKLKAAKKRLAEGMELLLTEGRSKAMTEVNKN